jgi:hypothetical protein
MERKMLRGIKQRPERLAAEEKKERLVERRGGIQTLDPPERITV